MLFSSSTSQPSLIHDTHLSVYSFIFFIFLLSTELRYTSTDQRGNVTCPLRHLLLLMEKCMPLFIVIVIKVYMTFLTSTVSPSPAPKKRSKYASTLPIDQPTQSDEDFIATSDSGGSVTLDSEDGTNSVNSADSVQ